MKLRDPDGFNYTDITELLDITLSAGKSSLHQAMQAYKLSLTKSGYVEKEQIFHTAWTKRVYYSDSALLIELLFRIPPFHIFWQVIFDLIIIGNLAAPNVSDRL